MGYWPCVATLVLVAGSFCEVSLRKLIRFIRIVGGAFQICNNNNNSYAAPTFRSPATTLPTTPFFIFSTSARRTFSSLGLFDGMTKNIEIRKPRARPKQSYFSIQTRNDTTRNPRKLVVHNSKVEITTGQRAITTRLNPRPLRAFQRSRSCHSPPPPSLVEPLRSSKPSQQSSSSSSSSSSETASFSIWPKLHPKAIWNSIRVFIEDIRQKPVKIFGHIAFLCSLSAFSMPDMLVLRSFLIGSSLCTIIYNVKGSARPSMLPITWSLILIAVNVVHISRIFLEKKGIQLTDEEEEVYYGVFEDFFTPVEFRKLLRVGNWQEFEPGVTLIEQGQKVDKILFIAHGVCAVEETKISSHPEKPPKKSLLCYIKQDHMIGGMEWYNDAPAKSTVRTTQPTRCVVWDKEELQSFLMRHPVIKVGWNTLLSRDAHSKLLDQKELTNEQQYKVLLYGIVIDDTVTKQEFNAIAEYRQEYGITPEIHERVLASLGWTDEDLKRGTRPSKSWQEWLMPSDTSTNGKTEPGSIFEIIQPEHPTEDETKKERKKPPKPEQVKIVYEGNVVDTVEHRTMRDL